MAETVLSVYTGNIQAQKQMAMMNMAASALSSMRFVNVNVMGLGGI